SWRRPSAATPPTTWSWRRRRRRAWTSRTGRTGWRGWRRSTTTCVRRCAGCSNAVRPRRPCGRRGGVGAFWVLKGHGRGGGAGVWGGGGRVGAGLVRRAQSDLPSAIAIAEQSIALRRALGDRSGLAEALNILADTLPATGDLATAAALGTESLAIRRAVGDRLGTAWSRSVPGNIARPARVLATAPA